MLCALCDKPISGTRRFGPGDVSTLATLQVLHLIDDHFPLVLRIRQTTHNGPARMQLVSQLATELKARAR